MADLKPFENNYPYTNFEQLNIDWILQQIGSFDGRIKTNAEAIDALDVRTGTLEIWRESTEVWAADVSQNLDKLSQDINAVDVKADGIETRTGALEVWRTSTESWASDVSSDLDGFHTEINAHDIRLDSDESKITDLETFKTQNEERIQKSYDYSNMNMLLNAYNFTMPLYYDEPHNTIIMEDSGKYASYQTCSITLNGEYLESTEINIISSRPVIKGPLGAYVGLTFNGKKLYINCKKSYAAPDITLHFIEYTNDGTQLAVTDFTPGTLSEFTSQANTAFYSITATVPAGTYQVAKYPFLITLAPSNEYLASLINS